MKTNFHISLIAFTLFSTGALAQTAAPRTLDDVLTHDKGMTQISSGLYSKTTASSESFVAVSAAGRQAMLQRLIQTRAKVAARFPSGTSNNSMLANPSATSVIDHAIAELSQPETIFNAGTSSHRRNTGDCTGLGGTGLPALYADVASSGGNAAGGSGGITTDSNPPTQTSNYAAASTTDGNGVVTSSHTSTTVGTTAASASATAPAGTIVCYANVSASVTCPGKTNPSVSAFANSWANQPNVNCT